MAGSPLDDPDPGPGPNLFGSVTVGEQKSLVRNKSSLTLKSSVVVCLLSLLLRYRTTGQGGTVKTTNCPDVHCVGRGRVSTLTQNASKFYRFWGSSVVYTLDRKPTKGETLVSRQNKGVYPLWSLYPETG